MEHVKAKFTWLEGAWGESAEKFEALMGSVISQATRLDQTAPVGNMINEYAPSWWTRMCRALVRMEKPKHHNAEEWHPEDPHAKTEPPAKPNPQARLQRALSIMNPHIHELRAESYFGMIRLLKPGCRSLILLVDEQSKEKLMMQFAQYILPLRK
ncbi:unnamed protein product [Cylicostephanus goldi]|uniref:Uncharacterized protein n=1 Tax=Cylicostephanus goldi TaxID=71465 RepID=A0A3P7NG51_CYLGO|nr:unnamed protein product [Cylicostephanus goldi]